jgi:EmrB/QacA subfamily drug resistance transporter
MPHITKQPCDDGVMRSAPSHKSCSRWAKPWVLAATILGSSMAMIDGTVVNVGLPAIQASLNATSAQLQWIVEAYALFLAALILVGGSLGDRYGRRRIFAIGVVVFAVASVGCGVAATIQQLIMARAVQGIGGALLVPGSLAIIGASFDQFERGRAIGTWSGFTAITSAIGPLMGGWLIEHTSWRWIFFLNVPVAIVVIGILFYWVSESRNTQTPRLDWVGALLATIGLGATVYGLIEASHLAWTHPTVVMSLIIGSTALIAFIGVEARSHHPMMPLSLFQSRTFSGANLLTLFLYAALSGALFFLPFNLIQVQGYSATAAGAAFLPFILLMFVLSHWSGGLVSRYGAKRPLVIGPLIVALGFALFALPGMGGSYWTTFFPAVVVLGLGMAVSVPPLTTVVMGAVSSQQAGIASGINNAVARTAGLLAIAILSLVMTATFNFYLDRQFVNLNIPVDVQRTLDEQRIKLAGAEVPDAVGDFKAVLEQAIDQSFLNSFRLVMLIASGMACLSAFTASRLIEDNAGLQKQKILQR